MKKVIIGLLFAVLAAGAMPAFAKLSDSVEVQINKEVTVAGGLKIAFIELVEDSRCPTDVNCIWAGNAKIKVRVTKNGRSKVLELDTLTRGMTPSYGNYQVKLKELTPKPRSNIRINRNGYVATIEVTKI
ncbi:MAG TPA: hypothetical protein PLK77_08070 [Pyrinomonadaceae bacterium]|nr:hypothetical protein [Pyrinomonadaceae bacterium]